MYEQYPFSEQKQQEENVNEKETDPIWSQFFPVTVPHCQGLFYNLVERGEMTILIASYCILSDGSLWECPTIHASVPNVAFFAPMWTVCPLYL